MAEIVVNLEAYVIPDDHAVFKFSPGKTYRFYLAVKNRSYAFLDIRGLENLPDDPEDWNQDEVLSLIRDDRWDREIESRERGNKPKGTNAISPIDRRNLTFLNELIWDAKKGDLIVVPADGYRKDVLIGEFTTQPGSMKFVEAQDGEETFVYPGRKVKWLAAIEKRFLSEDLIEKLHNPNAIFLLGKSLRNEVYRYAYENFVHGGEFFATFRVGKEKFTSEDSAVVSTWLNGFDYVRAFGTDTQKSFYEMGLAKIPDDQAAELRINVNSPGAFFIKSKDPFALTLMAMLVLSSCSPQAIATDGVKVQMKKVGGATVECEHQIEENIAATAAGLGHVRLEEACKLGERAVADAKVSTDAKIES